MIVRRCLLACAASLLAACASAPRTARPGDASGSAAPPPAPAVDTTTGGRWYGYEGGLVDAEKAAASIEGAAQYWNSVEGEWRTADDSGSFRAYFRDNHLRRLTVTFAGAQGTGTGAYTYDDRARLFHYQGEARRRTGSGSRTQRVTLSVAVDPKGAVSATRRTVAGKVQPLAQDELQVVMAREAAARAAAVRILGAG